MENQRTSPFVGSASAGSIAVRAVRLVVAESSSTPSPTASGSPSGAAAPQAYLLASIVNRGKQTDRLTNATVSGGAVQPVGGDSTSLTLSPGQLVQFGDPDQGTTGTALGVGALSSALVPGQTTTVSFTFETAGTVTVVVPIQTLSDIGTTAPTADVGSTA